MCEWYIFDVSGNEFMVNAVRLDIWVPRDSEIYFHQSKYYCSYKDPATRS